MQKKNNKSLGDHLSVVFHISQRKSFQEREREREREKGDRRKFSEICSVKKKYLIATIT